MASAVPRGFIDLQTASTTLNHDVNFIGVATDVMPPTKSQGKDYMCTFTLADASFSDPGDGLQVRFFKPEMELLPKIQGIGDVVILRSMKIQSYRGVKIAVSKWTTTWLVFPAGSIPKQASSNFLQIKHEKDRRAGVPSTAEMLYAISLCNSRDRSNFNTIANPSAEGPNIRVSKDIPEITPQRREKFSLIKDVQIDMFYDLVGQVVKKYPSNGCVELSITDYTTNQLLYNYEWAAAGGGDSREGDPYNYTTRNSTTKKWPGPFGRMTLTVALWPPHSYFVESDVKEQDFVLLQNVRIRFSKDAKVEGSIHTDQKYTDRINVSVLKDHRDDRVKNVLRRKQEYMKRLKAQSEQFIEEPGSPKRKENEPSENSSKSKARKKRKQQRSQLKEPERREESKKKTENEAPHALPLPKSNKQELNRNIKCSHEAVPPRPLSSILSLSTHAVETENGTSYTLPFQNINCRTTVRVIDFFPQDLADFAVRSRRQSEFDVLSENEENETTDDQSDGLEDEERGWEWRFGLVLEDAMGSRNEKKDTMTVYVADKDAEFLLRLDAENLRASPKALDTLREKLFLLWGDLEERKSKSRNQPLPSPVPDKPGNQQSNRSPVPAAAENTAPKSLPFVCCLKEYGIRSRRKDRDGQSDGSDADEEGERGKENRDRKGAAKGNQGWERRWRMWGVVIN